MRRLDRICLTGILTGLCAPALAQQPDLEAVYTGTVVETRADGTGGTIMFNRDGTVVMHMGPRTMNLIYSVNDKNEFCVKRPTPPAGSAPPVGGAAGGPPPGPPPGAGGPPPGAMPPCVLMPTKVGGSVDRKGPTGQNEHYELVAGRQPPPPQ